MRKLRIWCGLLLLAVAAVTAVRKAPAFTIWGQTETYQTAALSYLTRYWYAPTVTLSNVPPQAPGNVPYTELGGPKDINEGARLNVPTITYAYDYTFLDYFGVAGVKAVDSAFAILNNLPPVSKASPNLTEFIQQGNQQINYTARALNMVDLKSTVLQIMLEHMGLLGETHVYDILEQVPLGGTCDSEYFVGIRNFDPITTNASSYVNGTFYDFQIKDGCASGIAIADAMEEAHGGPLFSLSPDTTAVATAEALQIGGFYLGITRDDFGGLRYLYSQNAYYNEAMPPNTYVGSTISSAFSPSAATNTLDATWTGTVGGVEKINFVKVAYDSGIGYTFGTNIIQYNLNILTNFQHNQVGVFRTNTAPDMIFTAANLLGTPGPGQDQPFTRTATLIAAPVAPVNALSTVAEVFSPTNLITFNNAGPIGLYFTPGYLSSTAAFALPYFQWGSFDGSTNAPIAFPTSTSLAGLLALELSAPAGQGVNSSFNPILATNTTTAGGTGAGAVGGAGAAAAVARPNRTEVP